MGYAGFSLENFSSPFIPDVRIAETRTTDLGRRRRRTIHRVSLAQFLIFCKILSSKPSPQPSQSKAARFKPLRFASGCAEGEPAVEALGPKLWRQRRAPDTCARRSSHAPRACSPASRIQVRSAKAT